MPGPVPIGDWDEGYVVVSDECMDEFPVVLGYLSVFTLGLPGYVFIDPHSYYSNTFLTCADPPVELEYCYVQDGAILTDPPNVRDLCGPNPVREITWGAVKALYR